jgi:hypothetical protein
VPHLDAAGESLSEVDRDAGDLVEIREIGEHFVIRPTLPIQAANSVPRQWRNPRDKRQQMTLVVPAAVPIWKRQCRVPLSYQYRPPTPCPGSTPRTSAR